MRQILVDHARSKSAQKRGGGVKADALSDDLPASMQLRVDPDEVLALSDALNALELENPEAATIVKMRAFAGIECDEIAALLNVSRRTVERRWRFAMAELRSQMSGDAPAQSSPSSPSSSSSSSSSGENDSPGDSAHAGPVV
jgi:RNA polymerase sigma factor (TIGR02999 family)